MQGVTTYQVTGTPRFDPAAVEIPADDVAMVAEQAQVSIEKAKEALVATNGDIAEAIVKLSSP
jgi:nascent polypeptide-associated complex subunit alpha